MCINESLRAAEIKKRDEAAKEVSRCTKGISYFEGWKEVAISCRNSMIEMRNHNFVIANQCEQIKINGDRIDNGRYYTKGQNATYFTGKLSSMIGGLYNLINEMQRVINELEVSKDNAKRERTKAINRIKALPVPCEACSECCPQTTTTTPTITATTPTNTGRRGGPQVMAV